MESEKAKLTVYEDRWIKYRLWQFPYTEESIYDRIASKFNKKPAGEILPTPRYYPSQTIYL